MLLGRIKSCGLSGILFKAMDQIEKFVKDSGLTISAYNVCFYDSNGTDEILDNILCGKKRANTGLFSLFEAQMQLLPRTGDYTVVLDSDMQPRCITRTTKVEVVPFEDVTADCAAAEGGRHPLPRGRKPTARRLLQRVRKSAGTLTKA